MSNNQGVVIAEQLVKTFDEESGEANPALDGISITIESGKLTALVGPDGAGKTTFMRLVNGLLKPTSGKLLVLGHDVVKHPQLVQDKISYMPQRFGLYDDLSVMENLNLYADLHGVPHNIRNERFQRMLDMTDMAKFTQRLAGNLSGGMKQKLGLACTLVRSPDLLLLDEPSVGVDPLSRRDLWNIVERLVEQEQLSVIVNTAYMDEAQRCANVFVMHEGKVLSSGTPEQLKAQANGLTYSARTPNHLPTRELQARLIDAKTLIVDAVPKGGEVQFITHKNHTVEELQSLLKDTSPVSRDASLEDAFMLMLHQQTAPDPNERDNQSGAITDDDSLSNIIQVEHGPEDSEPAIKVKNLVRKFADFTAVASTSFDVARGEIFGLLGPNGAGKTTTFRMLCGLLPATSGELNVAGHNLRQARAKARTRIGYVAQKFALYGNLSVTENLRFYGGAYGLRGKHLKQRIAHTLSQFNLPANARSGDLPAGYKQRLAMATGLLHEPEILFLDEPTSGIDPLARRAFWRTITELAKCGVTIIITTHFMEEAEYCDRIAIQDAGRLLALGTPAEVRNMAGDEKIHDMNQAFIAIVENDRAKRKDHSNPQGATA
jgi:ABC-2 type transport system ATP-binding protein